MPEIYSAEPDDLSQESAKRILDNFPINPPLGRQRIATMGIVKEALTAISKGEANFTHEELTSVTSPVNAQKYIKEMEKATHILVTSDLVDPRVFAEIQTACVAQKGGVSMQATAAGTKWADAATASHKPTSGFAK